MEFNFLKKLTRIERAIFPKQILLILIFYIPMIFHLRIHTLEILLFQAMLSHKWHTKSKELSVVRLEVKELLPLFQLETPFLRNYRGIYLCLIFEMSIWEFITNSKKIRFQNKLDILSSSNLIFTACVACKNQFRNQIDFSIF